MENYDKSNSVLVNSNETIKKVKERIKQNIIKTFLKKFEVSGVNSPFVKACAFVNKEINMMSKYKLPHFGSIKGLNENDLNDLLEYERRLNKLIKECF